MVDFITTNLTTKQLRSVIVPEWRGDVVSEWVVVRMLRLAPAVDGCYKSNGQFLEHAILGLV